MRAINLHARSHKASGSIPGGIRSTPKIGWGPSHVRIPSAMNVISNLPKMKR